MDIMNIYLVIAVVASTVLAQTGTDLKNLKTQLFTTNTYNTKVRPVTDQTKATAVTVDFALVGINSLSDTDQKLTTTGYITLKWTDELLVWTPATYGGLQSILVPQNEVWKPDITLDNGLESKESLGQTFIQVKITNTGGVTWSPYEVFETSCSVNIAHFPFDKQTCEIKFVTWMNNNAEVTLQFGTDRFFLKNYEENGKWKIDSMSSSSTTTSTKTILTFTLNLSRKPTFYILFLILPAIILSLLNVFVFVLPAGSGEKIGYSIAVFLSYAIFYTILSESLPKNSDTVSTVAAYMFFMMFLSTLACIVTIIELRIYNKETHMLPRIIVSFTKLVLLRQCMCKRTNQDEGDDDVDGEWTRVIGPWLDSDWKDFVDALDFVLFWIFLIVTVISTILAFVLASSNVAVF